MTKKQRLLFQIAGLLLLLVFFVRPMTFRLIGNLETRKQMRQKLARLEIKLSVLEGIDQVLIEDRAKRMEAVFPSVKPVVTLMASLSQLAAEHNLSFGGVSLSPGSLTRAAAQAQDKSKAADNLYDLRFGFEIGGDFDHISRFMVALENTAPLMKIEEVGLSIKTNPLFDREETLVVANIKVAAYYQAPPDSIGSVEKPVVLLSRDEEELLNRLLAFKVYPPILPQVESGKENLFE